MSTRIKANLLLLLVTMFWGSSYLSIKMGLTELQQFNLIALRFIIAFILAGVVFYHRIIHTDFRTVQYALLLGTILFLVFVSLTFGMKSTSASNAGFLVSLTVIFVPLLVAVFVRKIPEKRVLLGVTVALIGIGFLTLKQSFTISNGDFLCILCALFNATHIILTGKFTKKPGVDAISLGVIQLGFTGIWGLLFTLLFESPEMPSTTNAWISVLGLGVLCSAIAFVAQTTVQKYTTPTHTGLLFSLEPVFAAIFAFAFAGEVLTTKGYIGACLVLLGVIIAEVDFKKLITKKQHVDQQNHCKKSVPCE